MIEKITVKPANSQTCTPQKPSFRGVGDFVLRGIQLCEQHPMVNVAVLDLSTAIVPRTLVESKTNPHAGFEAFRRESSGLIVNCLIPSFVVLGMSGLMNRPIMKGFTNSNLTSCWANNDTLNKVSNYYMKAGGEGRKKVENTVRSILSDLEGVDGNVSKGGLKAFKEFNLEQDIQNLTDAILDPKGGKKVKEIYKSVVGKTHASEYIRFKGDKKFFSKNLDGVIKDTQKLVKGFVQEGIKDSDTMAKYIGKAKKLVNAKSLAGLAVIIPLAASMQAINRWITRKSSGQKGAPIYKDFGTFQRKEPTAKEKSQLFAHKLLSAGTMIGVALLSMMKKPSMEMFQFKGMFPSMDQARVISATTFASRMLAAEDKNELREATVRDIVTFSSLYFLGDYAAKGTATLIEKLKPDVKLINRLKEVDKNSNVFKKFWNWVKNTSLKSSDEVVGKAAKNLRSACQLSNIGFSLALLGILIPVITRNQTNKRHQRELQEAQKLNFFGHYSNFLKTSPAAFKAFFTSQKQESK